MDFEASNALRRPAVVSHTPRVRDVHSGETFQKLFDALTIAVVAHGTSGRVVYANQAFADLLGYSLEQARRLTSEDVIHPDDRGIRDAQAAELFAGMAEGAVVHRRLLRADGSVVRARVRKSVVDGPDHQPLILVQIESWSDLGELEHQVRHDHLTGLLNRHGFELAMATTHKHTPAMLAMIDIDDLKSVNDEYGHPAGDAVLAGIAESFKSVDVEGAIVCRWAGDEFVASVPPSPLVAEPDDLSRLLVRVAASPVQLPGTTRQVVPSVSIGTTCFDPATETVADAIARADQKMYRSRLHRRRSRYRAQGHTAVGRRLGLGPADSGLD